MQLCMHQHAGRDHPILRFDLERTKYQYSQPMLLGVLSIEVLNSSSISDESDVSYEGYEFLGGFNKSNGCALPYFNTTLAFQSVCIRWIMSSQQCLMHSIPFTVHYFDFSIRFICPLEGVRWPLDFLFPSDVVRC